MKRNVCTAGIDERTRVRRSLRGDPRAGGDVPRRPLLMLRKRPLPGRFPRLNPSKHEPRRQPAQPDRVHRHGSVNPRVDRVGETPRVPSKVVNVRGQSVRVDERVAPHERRRRGEQHRSTSPPMPRRAGDLSAPRVQLPRRRRVQKGESIFDRKKAFFAALRTTTRALLHIRPRSRGERRFLRTWSTTPTADAGTRKDATRAREEERRGRHPPRRQTPLDARTRCVDRRLRLSWSS